MLTNNQKIVILERAVYLIQNGIRDFMCTAIDLELCLTYGIRSKACDEIPELLKYKPPGMKEETVWFQHGNKSIRIQILNEIIKELKERKEKDS